MTPVAVLLLALSADAAAPVRVARPVARTVPAVALGALPVRPAPTVATRLWSTVPGSSRVLVGDRTLVDRRAPGARLLLRSLESPTGPSSHAPVIGFFQVDPPRVLNSFVQGEEGVIGHREAAPPQLDPREQGGYVLHLGTDGKVRVKGSGSYFHEITPPVMRALERHFGLSPAEQTRAERLRRGALNFWDAANSLVPKS